MKLTHLVLACQVIVLLLSKETLSYDQGTWNWFDAQKKCKSQRGSLVSEGLSEVNSTETFQFWSGIYRRISDWIKLFGCYTDKTTEALSTTLYKMPKANSVGFCQEICMSSNMSTFAIKSNLCRCLKDRPDLEEEPVSPLLCNTPCYAPGVRTEQPYFDECGGNGTYSVYISEIRGERKITPGTFCVAIQCSAATHYTFHFEEPCSQDYRPVCQLKDKVSNISGSWLESMQICKSMPSSSYLTGQVFLHDINRTCEEIGRELRERSWLGVANEIYNGIDRVGITIAEEDRYLFNECQLCSYKDGRYAGCDFIHCDTKKKFSLICVQMDQDQNEELSSQTTSVLHTAIIASSDGKPKATAESIVSSTPKTIEESTVSSAIQTTKTVSMTSIPTTEKTTHSVIYSNEDEKNEKEFHVIVPIGIAVGLGGIIFALVFTYLCYLQKKKQTSIQKSRHEERKSDATSSKVKGIINYGYFTVELQEQVINSSNPEQKSDSPFVEAKDDTYDHLRDKESRYNKDENQYNYDTTRNIKAKIEQDKQSNDETYDRLGDERCGRNTDDTYHHVFTTTNERSEYDITEIKKQCILNSPYSHVMRIVPAESDTEQDDSSNTSEEMNEDRPDFILEQD